MQKKIKAKVITWLKSAPMPSQDLAPDALQFVPAGREYGVETIEDAPSGHWLVTLAARSGKRYVFADHWSVIEPPAARPQSPVVLLDKEFYRYVMPNASRANINTYLDPINATLARFAIETPSQVAMFIAQLAHESGSLRYKEEIADGSAYEGRADLGNIRPGWGVRYKGRGLIQLTGATNYKQAGEFFNMDLMGEPERVADDPYLSAGVAGWFWHTRQLNRIAKANNLNAFKQVTRRINGGLNGLNDRLAYWNRARSALSL
jgi:putative chitinase